MVNRKLFRPTLTDVKDQFPARAPQAAPQQGTAAQETCAAGANPRRKFLLCEANAVANSRCGGADRRRNSARQRRMVRPRLHQAHALRQPEPARLQTLHQVPLQRGRGRRARRSQRREWLALIKRNERLGRPLDTLGPRRLKGRLSGARQEWRFLRFFLNGPTKKVINALPTNRREPSRTSQSTTAM